MRGRWVDDVLDGPCEIVLSNGEQPDCVGLSFEKNVLYEKPPPLPSKPVGRNINNNNYGRPLAKTVVRGRPLPTRSADTIVHRFGQPCEPRPPQTVPDGRKEPRPVRANVRLTDDGRPDLAGHVCRTTGACSANSDSAGVADGIRSETELRNAQLALDKYADRLKEIYRAYGAFLAKGPVTYRPLMTRLGLWQMLIDNRLYTLVSLADFDDILCESNISFPRL